MSNSPYRTMNASAEPQLTYLEKLFLKGTKWDKFLFHTIVIGKPIVEGFGIIFLIVSVLGAIGGALYLLACGVGWLETYCVTHNYLTRKQFVLGGFVSLLVIMVLVAIVTSITKAIQENNALWNRKLEHKLAPKLQTDEDGGTY